MSHKHEYIIDASSRGLSLYDGLILVTRIEWPEVQQVTAYKADLLTYDSVTLVFLLAGQRGQVTLYEEMEGFEILMKAMTAALPIAPANWYEQIIQPPFATNEMRLFSRSHSET